MRDLEAMETMVESEKELLEAHKVRFTEALSLAGAMLWADRRWCIPAWLLLGAPMLLAVLLPFEVSSTLWLFVGKRVIELSFLYLIASRWLKRLQVTSQGTGQGAYFRLLFLGVLFSLFFWVAAALTQYGTELSATSQMAAIVCLVVGVFLYLRYFFFFLPAALGVSDFGKILHFARVYTLNDALLALKVMLVPFGLMLLFQGLVAIPSPARAHPLVDVVVALGDGIFWLLTTYAALGVALGTLSAGEWRKWGFDPYREGRLSTLAVQTPAFLKTLFRPANGFKLLLFALLIFLANYYRAKTTPPEVETRVEQIILEDEKVTLILHLVDEGYAFRSLQPVGFVLGASELTPSTRLSQGPAQVFLADTEEELFFSLPPNRKEVRLRVELATERSRREMVDLEDVYLWYWAAKMKKLDWSEATLKGQEPLEPVEP